MSGGSWGYGYSTVQDIAERLMMERGSMRRALGRQLVLMVKALHDIEWVDSSDYGPGDDAKALKAALGENWKELTLAEAIKQIDEIKQELIDAIGGT